ncbi:hypothetical protein ACFFQW_19750 [Umezawaea endophytica]|uniref:PASTA domain-containing protein n=1 Tax=Umezawaea endophytica TaxID=1654476 RepID=A0A9X3AG50_9PSEU|nr:hypothetical protein [Umezawaea endophytica]MCS7479642.1 hypothetical protein [Umezawaea endophytica]
MKPSCLLVLAVALAACSAPAQPTGVASLVTSSASSTAAAAPSTERARQRLDMTDADREVVYAPYQKCLDKHGIAPRGTEGKKVDRATQQECDPLLPLPPWELDATNPDAHAFAEKTVACLRAKGVTNVEVSTNTESGVVGTTITDEVDPNAITGPVKGIDEVMTLNSACQQEVAGIR